ncbi:murein biosynthesis integral membrane protein MurJ [Jannaschia sp. CCS1]|uniref:murein biosynthesis integral membrane protein MurJ n=1 Tax=Jannaschia sp. (strain CCS1) TaxID=290400 RepID=UPI00006BFFA8|nr:murein biosynthesis integral membrane protein MurJ [Jannaschia sp. CCS1]ABD53813.1 integral membrane protein MviN [Jannaschia sp. CCS1]
MTETDPFHVPPPPERPTPKPIRALRGFFTVGFWTMASRILGFVRDILIAAFLGSGPVADAFLVAFSLPNMFRRFFAEGAFNTAFVPLFAKKVEGGDDGERFAQDAFSGLAGILIALTLLAQLAMPWLVLAMAGGFAGDERLPLAVDFGRIAFVYILFISLAALFSGMLNAIGRFAAAAAAPILLNIVLVSAMVLVYLTTPDGKMTNLVDPAEAYGRALSWGVPLAGIAQLALVWISVKRAGYSIQLRQPRLTSDMRKLVVIALPAMLAGGVVQVNLLVGRQVASFYDGAIAWLSYADRLYQLPLGVVGIAIGIVLLPDLSRRLRADDDAGGREALSRAGELAMALTIPAAVALLVISVPLISVLFQRGAFTADDTASTAVALSIYALGLPAFVLQKVLQPVYFAREDTRRPFQYALVAMAVNAVVAVGLSFAIGFLAAAVATTLAAWVMVGLLSRGRTDFGDVVQFDDRFRSKIWRICAASVAMGLMLFLGEILLGVFLGVDGLRYIALALLVAIGLGSYFGFARLFGAFSLAEMKATMRGRP